MLFIAAASIFSLAGTVLANPLTTYPPLAIITPCTSCPSKISVAPITVTSQYQAVSTCAPTRVCGEENWCHTSYPFETYQYVSTVIPCAFNSLAGSSTTVTRTDQLVTVSRFRTTVTKFVTPKGHKHAKPTPVYLTIGQDYVIPYNEIGPLAIPGYGGSGLCTECGPDANGARSQPIPVTECTAGPAGTKCVRYTHTLVSKPAPAATSTTAAACSTSFSARFAGTYTFPFAHTAPATTITSSGQAFTFPPQPYNIWASRWFGHSGPWNFVTTITHTITQTIPPSIQLATATHSVPAPPFWGREPWNYPSNGPEPSNPADSNPWADWRPSSSSSSFTNSPQSSYSAEPNPWVEWTSSNAFSSTDPSSTTNWGPSSTSASTTSSPAPPPSTTPPWASTVSSSSSTTSTTSTTTPAPALSDVPPSVPEIYITVHIANARYRKRAIDYVSFEESKDAVLNSDISAAPRFKLYRGCLIDTGNGEYAATGATAGSASLEEFIGANSASCSWTESGGFLDFLNASFCYTPDNVVFVVFPGGSTPSGCVTIVLGTDRVSSSTKTSTTTRTSTSVGPTNSSHLTERELESQEKDVEQPEVVENRAMQKRNGLLHKH